MPLTSQEIAAGKRCSNCLSPATRTGLARGEHLEEEQEGGSLGEIGSWQPGMPDQRYRTAYDPLPPSDATTTPGAAAIGESTTGPTYDAAPAHPDAGPVQHSNPSSTGSTGHQSSYGISEGEADHQPDQYGSGAPAYGAHPANPNELPATQNQWTGDYVPIQRPGRYGPGGSGAGGYGPPFNRYPPHDPNVAPDPDSPPWGVLEGIGVWIFSFAAIVAVQIVVLFVWVGVEQSMGNNVPRDVHNPTVIFVSIISEGVAHLLIIAVLWAVVTRMGQRPFWATLGSHWSNVPSSGKYGLVLGAAVLVYVVKDVWSSVPIQWHTVLILAITIPIVILVMARPGPATWSKIGFVIGIVVLSLILDVIVSNFLPQPKETDFEDMLKASLNVRILISAMAVITAPLVEEGVYRGVLYSALRRATGLVPSVVIVTVLFAGVHVPQYWGAWTNIVSITILSLFLTLVRAKSKSILPCIAIHTLYNVINSIFILTHKY
ncbi:MAG TPA: CPBP family glutamic-type intramembrane protease [Blastocatellia bacterium]